MHGNLHRLASRLASLCQVQRETKAGLRVRELDLAREKLEDEQESLRSELDALSMELAAARRSEEAALLHRTELEALVRELRGALSARPGADLPSESSLLLLVRGDLGWGWPDRGFRLPHSQKLRR